MLSEACHIQVLRRRGALCAHMARYEKSVPENQRALCYAQALQRSAAAQAREPAKEVQAAAARLCLITGAKRRQRAQNYSAKHGRRRGGAAQCGKTQQQCAFERSKMLLRVQCARRKQGICAAAARIKESQACRQAQRARHATAVLQTIRESSETLCHATKPILRRDTGGVQHGGSARRQRCAREPAERIRAHML